MEFRADFRVVGAELASEFELFWYFLPSGLRDKVEVWPPKVQDIQESSSQGAPEQSSTLPDEWNHGQKYRTNRDLCMQDSNQQAGARLSRPL